MSIQQIERARHEVSKYEIRKVQVRNTHNREIRKIQKSGGVYDHSNTRFFVISVPKSYIREFGLKQSDLFVWSISRRSPLTFTLKKIDPTEGDSA